MTTLPPITRRAALPARYATIFGGWNPAQKDHFDDGGLHDPVIARARQR